MNKETIEKADLRFVSKWGELRSVLSDRRRQYETKPKRCFGLPVILFFLLVLFAVFQTEIFSKKAPPAQPEASKVIVSKDISAALPPPEKHADNICKISKKSVTLPITATMEDMPPADDHSQPTALARTEPVNAKRLEKLNVEPKNPLGDQKIKLASILACQGVRNRQYIDETNVFHISETKHPYIWMEVRSEKQPFVLKHVYYCNGEKYCEVPLQIKYPRMRTWSYVTLKNPAHIGQWHVKVTGKDGDVLKRIDFEVIP